MSWLARRDELPEKESARNVRTRSGSSSPCVQPTITRSPFAMPVSLRVVCSIAQGIKLTTSLADPLRQPEVQRERAIAWWRWPAPCSRRTQSTLPGLPADLRRSAARSVRRPARNSPRAAPLHRCYAARVCDRSDLPRPQSDWSPDAAAGAAREYGALDGQDGRNRQGRAHRRGGAPGPCRSSRGRDAFAELYERYGRRAYNLALRMTGSEQDAAEAVQEAFLT